MRALLETTTDEQLLWLKDLGQPPMRSPKLLQDSATPCPPSRQSAACSRISAVSLMLFPQSSSRSP